MLRTVVVALLASALYTVRAPSGEPGPSRTGFAPVNGLRMFYEIHGNGPPLVLLHGGIGAVEMLAPILPALARAHQVIAVDLQAHGRTADIDRALSYEFMADDIAALLDHLGISRADLAGYSLGGGVALQTAIRHPERVGRLIVVSATFSREGWFPEVRANMARVGPETALKMKGTPPHELYSGIAPRPEDWPVLLGKLGELLQRDYDWSAEVAAIGSPTLIVAADADGIRPAHLVEFFGLFGGGQRDAGWDGSGRPASQLAIIPGTTHYDILRSPVLPGVIKGFLDPNEPGAH